MFIKGTKAKIIFHWKYDFTAAAIFDNSQP